MVITSELSGFLLAGRFPNEHAVNVATYLHGSRRWPKATSGHECPLIRYRNGAIGPIDREKRMTLNQNSR